MAGIETTGYNAVALKYMSIKQTADNLYINSI